MIMLCCTIIGRPHAQGLRRRPPATRTLEKGHDRSMAFITLVPHNKLWATVYCLMIGLLPLCTNG